MIPPGYTLDAKRLAALHGYAVLDTLPEPGFDDIVQLAAQICAVPVALVSLVDADRQWFKARIGFEPSETDLGSSVCAHALIAPDLLVIDDLRLDPRTRDNPLVTGEPHIRFYAGAPFRAVTGEVLGSLCVIDGQSRPGGLTQAQAGALRNLARLVTSQLELRRALMERDALVVEQREAENRDKALLHLGDRLREATNVAAMASAAAAIVGETLCVSRAGYGYFDEGDGHLMIEPDWSAQGVQSIAGRYPLDEYGDLRAGLMRGESLVVEDVCADPRTIQSASWLLDFDVRSLVKMPVREHDRTVALLVVHDRNPRKWSPEVLNFLRNVADRLEAGTARLKAEEEQRVLNHELSHRMKNTFAMIQAIATQTLRVIPDQMPVQAFTQRLHALSSAHDVLLQKHWAAAKFSDVVGIVLKSLATAQHFDIGGDEVVLGPRTTLSMSLLLHELTTNAIKYGSLSQDGGRVGVHWTLETANCEVELVLSWRETGGPPTSPPVRAGFGSKLIRMGLVGTGGVDLRYLSTGFEADFRAPLAQLQLS